MAYPTDYKNYNGKKTDRLTKLLKHGDFHWYVKTTNNIKYEVYYIFIWKSGILIKVLLKMMGSDKLEVLQYNILLFQGSWGQ